MLFLYIFLTHSIYAFTLYDFSRLLSTIVIQKILLCTSFHSYDR